MSENTPDPALAPAQPPAKISRPIPVHTGDGPGAPGKLTEDLLRDAVEAMPRCLYLETVANLLGVTRDTLRRWLRRGAKELRRRERGHPPRTAEDIYLRFHQEVMHAFAQTTSDLLDVIKRAAEVHWQAAAWMLERRCPDLWGRDRHEVLEMKRAIKELEARIAEMSPTGA